MRPFLFINRTSVFIKHQKHMLSESRRLHGINISKAQASFSVIIVSLQPFVLVTWGVISKVILDSLWCPEYPSILQNFVCHSAGHVRPWKMAALDWPKGQLSLRVSDA